MKIGPLNLNWEFRRKLPTNGGITENSYVLQNAIQFFSNLLNTSGQNVTADTALKLSAFWSCVRNISEDTAKVPFDVFQLDSKGNKKSISHPAKTLLNKKPSNISTPFTIRQTLIKNALMLGNGYAYIKRDRNAIPVELVLIDSRYVTVQAFDQNLYYIVNDPKSGVVGQFDQDSIFHIRGMGDGYVGQSIISYGAESIGAGLAVQTYAASFFGSGATLTGAIEIPGILEDENQVKAVRDSFTSGYKTTNGANNGIAILHGGAKFSKISAQPNEAQMIEARDFGVADICRWFRMPLSKVQSGATGSSNLEQLSIEYVTDCLMPWFVKLEQEIERKLMTEKEMDLLEAKFSVSMLMRGDMTSTSNYLKTLKYAGFITSNDGRRFLDMNTINETWANELYSPVNMIPSSQEGDFWKAKDNSQASQRQPGDGGQPQ